MIRYKDILKREELREFSYSSLRELTMQDLNSFLRSKYGDKYLVIRKAVVLELQEKAKDRGLSEDILDELAYLDIK